MTILDMLKKERLTFGNQLEGLEGQIEKQEEEIEKLKVRFILLKIRTNIWKLFFYCVVFYSIYKVIDTVILRLIKQ